jgi:predicted ATPase
VARRGDTERTQARSLELPAATSLCRLGLEEGRGALAEAYGRFTEGHETPDLKEARALLAGAP